LTDTKYKAGLTLPTDLLQARTQVNSATNQLIEVKRARAKQEHAIAILLGRPPSELVLEAAPASTTIPVIPAGLPVTLLSRRPDVAEAEHRLAAANAQIGIATANFFPRFNLSASLGFQSPNLDHLIDWEQRLWSIGPGISLPIFQGGQLTAALAQTKARYQELVASYRSTVLRSFQDVEDQLSDLHLLAEKAQSLEETLVSAREYSRLTEIQYRQGLTTYLQVIDANQTLLTNELSAAQAHSQRLIATVLLIKALGGGWTGDEPGGK
jgi:multidrug efflux system outer membrane protein